MFCTGDNELCDIAINELDKRTEEINTFPNCYLGIIYALAIQNKFPLRHIERVLSKEFVDLYFSKHQNIYWFS